MIHVLCAAMILLLVASVQAQPVDPPPSPAELRGWVDKQCVSYGKRIGVDYRGALESAIRGESAGLAELFRYTVVGSLDGEAGESHAAILFGLLQRWGDRRYARVLRAQKRAVRKAVVDDLPLTAGGELKFPLTSALAHDH